MHTKFLLALLFVFSFNAISLAGIDPGVPASVLPMNTEDDPAAKASKVDCKCHKKHKDCKKCKLKKEKQRKKDKKQKEKEQ